MENYNFLIQIILCQTLRRLASQVFQTSFYTIYHKKLEFSHLFKFPLTKTVFGEFSPFHNFYPQPWAKFSQNGEISPKCPERTRQKCCGVKEKQAMITLQEMAVFNSFMVHKWLSLYKKSVFANFLFFLFFFWCIILLLII